MLESLTSSIGQHHRFVSEDRQEGFSNKEIVTDAVAYSVAEQKDALRKDGTDIHA
jgi:hypothetical protein